MQQVRIFSRNESLFVHRKISSGMKSYENTKYRTIVSKSSNYIIFWRIHIVGKPNNLKTLEIMCPYRNNAVKRNHTLFIDLGTKNTQFSMADVHSEV